MNIANITRVLDSGGLVIMPTDTVYGIMADATNEEAIRRVYDAKKRDYRKPLILLMGSYGMIKKYTEDITEMEDKIIKDFFPGTVTIILRKNDRISNLISAGGDSVGIRVPDNKELLEIIKKLDRPLVSTSANISDKEVITNISMLDDELKKKIDYVCDGGEVVAASSVIIKVDNNEVRILREGKLSSEIRERFMNKVIE